MAEGSKNLRAWWIWKNIMPYYNKCDIFLYFIMYRSVLITNCMFLSSVRLIFLFEFEIPSRKIFWFKSSTSFLFQMEFRTHSQIISGKFSQIYSTFKDKGICSSKVTLAWRTHLAINLINNTSLITIFQNSWKFSHIYCNHSILLYRDVMGSNINTYLH